MHPPPEPCELCGARDFEGVDETPRDGRPLETALCGRCGLIRHLHPPSEEELAAYYAERYRRDYHGEEEPSPRRVARALRRGRALFARLRPWWPEGSPVFEAGAGLGLNLLPFLEAGAEVEGVEPNRAWRRFARERLGLPLGPERLEDLAPEPRFGLVLAVHVLEHLRSPRRGLRRLRGLLAPGGKLYVECPNIAAPFAAPGRRFHRAHIHNFSATTLRALAARCGLRIERAFAPDDDPTCAFLFGAAPERAELPPPEAIHEVRAALATGWLRYHLRPRYWRLRALQVGERLGEVFGGRRTYRKLLARRGACLRAP
ncbi:MAG: class I SAM-dependent methyltransferase [Planctomycetota bacterium]|nr:MAG: class I SAM-dependent methyltransferase [Planctomycetota bacterium]